MISKQTTIVVRILNKGGELEYLKGEDHDEIDLREILEDVISIIEVIFDRYKLFRIMAENNDNDEDEETENLEELFNDSLIANDSWSVVIGVEDNFGPCLWKNRFIAIV